MSDKPPLTYQSAGLDLDLYEQTLAGMAPLLRRTHTPRVLDGFGGFASLFSLDYNTRLFARNYRHPVLVSCTDGVGSKLKVAGAGRQARHGRHRSRRHVGQRLPLHRRRAAGVPRLPRHAEGRPGPDARPHQGDQRRLYGGRMLAGGRRDGHPAGLLPAGRLRHGRLLRRRRRARPHHQRPAHSGRRSGARPGQHRPALQRLQPGAQDRVRARRAENRAISCRNWAEPSARSCWSRRGSTSGR